MEKLIERIKRHEGCPDTIYLDSEGNVTGGYGHHFYVGSLMPKDIAEELLKMDIANAVSEFARIPASLRKQLNIARRRIIVEMIFNMGPKVMKFKKMWAAINVGDFETAANEMLDSLWAKQVKGRAIEMAEIMRKGED